MLDEQGEKGKTYDMHTPLTREVLYKLVWSEPMLKVAGRFGVSSSYMARVCTQMNVPRPARGYWAKIATGERLPIPSLPDPRPGDQLAWVRDDQEIQVYRPLPRPPSATPHSHLRKSTHRPSEHSLITEAREHFEAATLASEVGYLKPLKKLLVDLIVTKPCLGKALSFANELFLSLWDKGYDVVLAPTWENFCRAEVDEREIPRKRRGYGGENLWSPYRCTVVYIGTVAIGLTVIEMSENLKARYVKGKYIPERDYVPAKLRRGEYDQSWTTNMDFATGRICLQAYSPYQRADWVNRWQETKPRDLNGQIKQIVKELEKSSEIIARLVEEGERRAEIERKKREAEWEQYRREEKVRRAKEALKESREELFRIINAWGEVNRIEQFFKDVESRVASLNDDQKPKVLKRLRLARQMIGNVDALGYFMRWRSPSER